MEREEGREQSARKRAWWVRPVRMVLWVGVMLSLAIGAALVRAGFSSGAAAKGTGETLVGWGEVVLAVSLVILVGNFVWGVARWAQRWNEQRWKVLGGILRTLWAGVWRTVVFVAIFLIGTLVIAPKIEGKIVADVVAKKDSEWLAGQVGIREDFRQGKISADEYLRYMLAVGYGTEKVPEKYRLERAGIIPDIPGIIEEYGEDIGQETLELALEAMSLANVEVGLDVSGNVARNEKNIPEKMIDVALRAKTTRAFTKKATTLNKAVLSDQGNFIVFYTDAGEDRITDTQARELATMMERIVKNYEDQLGLKYSYTFHEGSWGNLNATQEVLRANGIDEEKYKTAMPVYVANPYSEETNTLAFYSGEHLAEWKNSVLLSLGKLLGIDNGRWAKSTVGVPNITILSANVNSPSLELVTAHELGHHYQNILCQERIGAQCPSEDFLVETGANWLAINVVDEQPEEGNVIKGHHDNYINYGTCYSIDDVLNEPPETDQCHTSGEFKGYPAVAFLQNYYEVVNGATGKLMNALLTEDSLYILRQQATEEEWVEVMRRLSQRNLTNDYKEASLRTEAIPQGQDLGCGGSSLVCAKTVPVRSTATKYLYFAADEYDHTKVTIDGATKLIISVLGKKTDGSWEMIMEGTGKLEYEIAKEGDYDMVAIVVANPEVVGRLFDVKLVEQEVEEIVDEDAEKSVVTEGEDGCMMMNFQELWDGISEIGESAFELLDVMGTDTNSAAEEFSSSVKEAKTNTEGHKLTVCETQIKTGVSLADVEASITKKLWLKIGTLMAGEETERAKIVVGFDKTKQQGKIFVLGTENKKVYVLELRVE